MERKIINNNNFKKALTASGMSMYELAKYSGVPYTTVNEINSGKLDINQCAAGTVHRLAGVLGMPAEKIMNPIDYLDGVKGRYKGIDYIWSNEDGTTKLLFEYKGEKVTLDTGSKYNIPSRYKYYGIIAGWMIQDHIDNEEWKKSILAEIERHEKK